MSHRKLYLFRHGVTDWNREGRIQGHLDVPLNEDGRSQARRLAPVLKRLGIQALLSSDLSRAHESARLAAHAAGAPVHADERLREIHLGDAQGLNRDEIAAKFGEQVSLRLRHAPLSDADVAALGCEPGEAVLARALASIGDFLARESHVTSLGICSHGGVIRRLLQHAIGDGNFPPPVPNAAIFGIEWEHNKKSQGVTVRWMPWLPLN